MDLASARIGAGLGTATIPFGLAYRVKDAKRRSDTARCAENVQSLLSLAALPAFRAAAPDPRRGRGGRTLMATLKQAVTTRTEVLVAPVPAHFWGAVRSGGRATPVNRRAQTSYMKEGSCSGSAAARFGG